MARQKERSRRRRSRGLFGRFTHQWEDFELEPETRKNIFAVIVLLVGILGILALFNAAGRVGLWVRPYLFTSFGWGGYVVPFLAAGFALLRLDPERFGFSRGRYVGVVLLLLSMHGLLHLFSSAEEGLSLIDAGRGGGYLGWMVSYWLRLGVGDIAAWVILIGIVLVSLMMITNRTPGELLARLREYRSGEGEEEEAEEELPEEAYEEEQEDAPLEDDASTLPVFSTRAIDGVKSAQEASAAEQRRATIPKRPAGPPYERPSLQLLSDATTRPSSGDVQEMQRIIQKTLETFGIPVTMDDVHVGPTVTQYTLKPEEGVKLAKITALHNDLALALSAHPIRIEAPIPGKALVGIEVPNKAVSIVRLREVLQGDAFRRAASPLTFALGKDVTGSAVVADLSKMPHLLIAGATGSGKSVMINDLVVSLLYRNSPATLRFLLIDPKRVELTLYNGIPHLLAPVVTEPDKAINALRWAVGEMDRRYTLLSEAHKRDIGSYNAGRRAEALPFVVIVIDELADIMARYGREVEGAIVRLAQMARAVGIHLVVATQRPSVDVITGLIKANITSRIAFNVASLVDSRTILDSSGAEKLLGNGDMLFLKGDISKPRRIQAPYVAEDEVKKVTQFLSSKGEVTYDDSITSTQRSLGGVENGLSDENGEFDDALMEEAERVVREAGRASTSLLQRRLRIGYSRAARMIDMLEERGVVGPADGSRPREVLGSASEGRSPMRSSRSESEESGLSADDQPEESFDESEFLEEDEEQTDRSSSR